MANAIGDMGEGEAGEHTGRAVLVVDDSRTTLELIARRLERLGYAATTCEDGAAALALLRTRRFDLVLLDMVMPGLSGLRTLRALRGEAQGAELPVIMMTARRDPAAAVEALGAGADDHVGKPIDFAVLAARIDRLLSRAGLVEELRRANAALDARIADHASETDELRACLAAIAADRRRLEERLSSLRA